MFGGALRFDGKDDQVVVPDHPSLKDLKQLTVEAWIRMSGQGGRQFICGKDSEWHFDITEDGGSIGLSLYSHSGKKHMRTGTGGFYFPLFQWAHVAATYDGRQVKFFQNGVLVDTFSGPEDYLLTSTRPLLIGPTPIRDWSSRQVSFNRFRKAFIAALSSCGLCAAGCGASAEDMENSLLR